MSYKYQEARNALFKVNAYSWVIGLFFVCSLVYMAIFIVYPGYFYDYIIKPLITLYYSEVQIFYKMLGANILKIPFLNKFVYYYAQEQYPIGVNEYGETIYGSFVNLLDYINKTGTYPPLFKNFAFILLFFKMNFYMNMFNLLLFSPVIGFITVKAILNRKIKDDVYKKAYREEIARLKKFKKDRENLKFEDISEYEIGLIKGTKEVQGIHNLRELDFYLKTIYLEHYSIKDLTTAIWKFKLNIQKVLNEFKYFANFINDVLDKDKELFNKIANKDAVVLNQNFIKSYFFPYLLLDVKQFRLKYTDSTGKKHTVKYTEDEIALFKLIPYWMLLFKLAKLSRNFPQALLSKVLHENTGHLQASKVVKWMDSNNIPQELGMYYFYFDMINEYKVLDFLKDVLGETVFKKYLEYKNNKNF